MSLIHKLLGRRRVKMVMSVGEHAAGNSYALPADVADKYIARAYAEGKLSRAYTPEELNKLRGNPQVVKIGG